MAACRLTLQGPVQGIGLRPTVARLAMELGLAGHVRNAVDGVEIWLEGSDASITEFRRRLTESAPVAASGVSIRQEDREPLRASGFEIITSQTEGAVTTRVPPDQAVCETCRREVETAGNRRYGYAFTSCVDCGPRYSVIESMPYDRCRTSMRAFPLCTVCEKEYTTASDRRFHAQTNACPNCGPNVWLSRQGQRLDLAADAALQETAQALLQGEIVALRGLGGYQLLVDATNTAAIDRLRQRKRRRDKPLAVMVRSLAEAEQIAVLTDQERSLLTSAARPIVLVAVRATCSLNTNIHPGLAEVGLFLPTTPLHWLLLEHAGRPLIVTSGNVEGDPLAVSPVDAERSLNQIADLWLHHDREITRPVDDSVVRFLGDTPVVIRHARGFAPAALPHLERFAESLLVRSPEASGDVPQVLAVGGHQKSAIALYNGRQAILGPHLGDLETLQARQRFDDQARALLSLYRCVPDIIVHDLHPDYFSTTWADSATREFLCQLTETTDKPQRSATACRTIAVQHHHAHVVSGMVQNDWLDREVLGVAFDGTGFGSDGTVWGGEFLRATADEFQRIGHL
ncbi:MAG: carbamoyltransferase HypF, partial [Rhodopirellula sp.]|nr:carbamoyltransferase HypF [Rhodopirellula sp.]